MPGLAKFLAVLNILAAGGFIYLAAIDWQKRTDWALEVFRRELAINGLPINDFDASWRIDRPIRQDIGNETIQQLFKGASKDAVYTQLEELKRVQGKVKEEIEALPDEKAKKDRLRQIILDQATTAENRLDESKPLGPNEPLEVYWKRYDKLFDDIIKQAQHEVTEGEPAKPYSSGGAREAIAHLLYNLSSDPNHHQRVMVVIGLRPYILEAERQAHNFREMANRLRNMMVDDRTLFEAEYGQLVQRILGLAEAIEQMSVELGYKKDLKERSQVELNKREADRERLIAELGRARDDRGIALSGQGALEKELFRINAELGLIKEQTEILERELRGLERSGGR